MSDETPPGDAAVEQASQRRIEELEIRAAYQDRTIEQLDGVVQEFTKRVEQIERDLKALAAELESRQPDPRS